MRLARARGSERGSFMLGFAGLIVFLAILCGSVLFQSLQAYRSSAFHLWRLQARAAAEGAAVALSRSAAETTQPLTLGDAIVTPGAPSSGTVATTASQAVLLQVEVRRGGRAVYRENYSARFDEDGESTAGLARKLVALETVR